MKKKHTIFSNLFLFIIAAAASESCTDTIKTLPSTYKYVPSDYTLLQLKPTKDTIRFVLTNEIYNSIKSFNTFKLRGSEYIAFFDDRSKSISIYHLNSQKTERIVSIKKTFSGQKFYKTTAYIKNFDSIFVTNNSSLYLIDSFGNIVKKTDFFKSPPYTWAYFTNTTPAVIANDKLYACIRPYVEETSISALRKWKTMYGFNLHGKNKATYYHLPELYQKDLFGYDFLEYSYCYNDRKNFVFSFPADTNIYETDLETFQDVFSAKSECQKDIIEPVSKKDLENNNGGKQYSLRNSYGAIYFDAAKKRYLRFAKQKVSESDYQAKKRTKKTSVIILNENMKIVGESPWDPSILYNALFFSGNGDIYARVVPKDENAILFIRMEYEEKKQMRNWQQ